MRTTIHALILVLLSGTAAPAVAAVQPPSPPLLGVELVYAGADGKSVSYTFTKGHLLPAPACQDQLEERTVAFRRELEARPEYAKLTFRSSKCVVFGTFR